MSFDLTLHGDGKALRKAVSGNLNTRRNGEGWIYENRDTEVSFAIDIEVEAKFWKPAGELTVAINFLRPSFFFHEALAFTHEIAQQSGAQDALDGDALYRAWHETTLQFGRSQATARPILEMDKSLELWHYNQRKAALFRRGLFAPTPFTHVDPLDSNHVVRSIVWSAGLGLWVPPVEFVLVLPGAPDGSDGRVVRLEEWTAAVGGARERDEQGVWALSIADAADVLVAVLELEWTPLGDLIGLGYDGWIDA